MSWWPFASRKGLGIPYTWTADYSTDSLYRYLRISSPLRTVTGYDILDRTVSCNTYHNSVPLVQTSSYAYISASWGTVLRTSVTDPLNRTTQSLADAQGRTVSVTDANMGTTQYTYDALGQLLESVDPEGFATSYLYDPLGRPTRRTHPDAGTTFTTYDPVGNVVSQTNAESETVTYQYYYLRPVSRQYSKYPLNGVSYIYNAAGQVSVIQDGSGIQHFFYDALGNVSKNVRTFAVPYSGHTYTFTMEYEYDSWGRMLAMTYPDGERVSYSYDHGGNLFSMSGVKNSVPYDYIKEVIYDRYGNRSRIEHGNLSHTEYTYDDLQRLSRLKTYAYNSGNTALIQDIAYTFDNVGNITDAANNVTAFGTLGGVYSNCYSYDVIDRLTGAVQSYGSGNTLATEYSRSGRLCSRSQTFSSQASIFGYDVNIQPHAPRRVLDNGNMTLHDIMWDMNGNMAMVNEYVIGEEIVQSSRSLFWTEDNRLASVVDEKNLSYYAYDHSGGSCGSREQSQACLSYAEMEQRRQCQRVLKLTGKNSLIDVNAEMVNYYSLVGDVTLYTSPYLVANNSGYTKHYYAGSERICARLGNGSLNYHQTQAQPFIGNNAALEVNSQALFSSVMGSMSDRGLTDNSQLTIKALCNNGPDPLSVQLKPVPMKVGVATAFTTDLFDDAMGQYAIQTQQNESPYFYHSDHLGSASWITDAAGIPVQHLQYLPFGEPFVNQHTSGYQERFTFTGKERDSETGYSYFSARYLDHEILTSFMSVDKYADKYPFISPYAYCAWNPIKLTDPSGDTIIFNDQKVEKMFEDVYNEVSCRMITLMNKGLKKESRREEYEALSKIKQSMDDVRSSKMKFYYSSLPNPDGSIKSEGHTYGKKSVDGIIVEITAGCFGTLVHETKHASQYSSGDWELDMGSIDEYGHYGLINYDLQDEFDAYRQENNYQFYINRGDYYDDDRIKTEFVNGYKQNPLIIPEYIQYNVSNPYKK